MNCINFIHIHSTHASERLILLAEKLTKIITKKRPKEKKYMQLEFPKQQVFSRRSILLKTTWFEHAKPNSLEYHN